MTTEPHRESKETFDFIAQWAAPDFFYSRGEGWGRMGLLGPLGDFILLSTAGAVLEIGVGESSVFLTALAKKYKRRIIHCDIQLGKILGPMSVPGYLSEENILIKSGEKYDGDKQCVLYAGSSDGLFADISIPEIALGFIDGDHIYEQAKKDFYNLLPHVVDDGYVILHDSYPPYEDYTDENKCGTVYKLRQELDKDTENFDTMTMPLSLSYGVAMTIVRKKPKDAPYYQR